MTGSRRDRYKDTAIVSDGLRGLYYAPWEPPVEFSAADGDYTPHRVQAPQVGFLDLLAVIYYGQGMETLGWVIAYANGLIDPEREMFPGQLLRIPSRIAVIRFLERAG